jgi:hypothetical protein
LGFQNLQSQLSVDRLTVKTLEEFKFWSITRAERVGFLFLGVDVHFGCDLDTPLVHAIPPSVNLWPFGVLLKKNYGSFVAIVLTVVPFFGPLHIPSSLFRL